MIGMGAILDTAHNIVLRRLLNSGSVLYFWLCEVIADAKEVKPVLGKFLKISKCNLQFASCKRNI